jgi:hypothetical protein
MNLQRIALVVVSTGFVLLLGLVVLGERPADGQAVPDVLRARAIELVDGNGRVRAQLNVDGEEVVFRLRDQNGTIRTKLGADASGSGLLLNDNRTQPGVHILASRRRTSLTLRRDRRRRVLRP